MATPFPIIKCKLLALLSQAIEEFYYEMISFHRSMEKQGVNGYIKAGIGQAV
jgi:hypothetical protein